MFYLLLYTKQDDISLNTRAVLKLKVYVVLLLPVWEGELDFVLSIVTFWTLSNMICNLHVKNTNYVNYANPVSSGVFPLTLVIISCPAQ